MNPLKINDTTYEVTLPAGDRVEIGEREAISFQPRLKLNRWDGECFIKLGLATTSQGSPVIEGEKVRWVEPELEACFYPLEPVGFTRNQLGGFEFEVILKQRPQTNQVVLDIETRGLRFCYQPPLTQEEIAQGEFRPENVVGSYAVYHAGRGNLHASVQQAERYKCGKAFHIYRPKITDAKGDWVWAELNIDEAKGKLIITVDQNWLDEAVYPVVVDPTFGYETMGASEIYTGDDFIQTPGGPFAGVDGSGMSMSFACRYSSGGYFVQMGLYDSDRNLVTNGYTESAEIPTSAAFVTADFSVSPSLSSQKDHYLCFNADHNFYYRYDDGAPSGYKYYSHTFGTWPDSIPSWNSSDNHRIISIYCTYTEGEGEDKFGEDYGAGADDRLGYPKATLTIADTGSGTDWLPAKEMVLPDAGVGVEACVSLQTPAAKASSDNGCGVEAIVIPGAALIGSESGSGVEAFIARLLAAAENGYGVEASEVGGEGMLKNLFAGELGEGADGLIAKIEMPTKGGGMRLWT